MRVVKKIAIWTFSILLGLFTTVVGFVHFYEDDIAQMAVDELNKQLKSPVHIRQIKVSVWSDFPNARIEFVQLHVPDAFEGAENDTLLYLDKLYMSFDVWDMVDGNFTFESLHADNGVLKVRRNIEGQNNYDIFKPSDEVEESDDFSFKLSSFTVQNLRMIYDDKIAHQNYAFRIHDADLQGEMYNEDFDLSGHLDFWIYHFKNKQVNLIANKDCSLDALLKIHSSDTSLYEFNDTKLRVEDMHFMVEGMVKEDSATYCDIAVTGDKISLSSFFTSFSKTITGDMANYKSTGIVDFHAYLKGYIGNGEQPEVNADFAYENGTITEPSSNITLSEASLKGTYSNVNDTRTDVLKIENFKAKLPDGSFEAHFSLEDFMNPLVDGSVKGHVNLETVQNFLKLESVDRINGSLWLNAGLKAKIFAATADKAQDIRIYKSSGLVEAKEVDLQLRDTDLKVEDLNGAIVLKGDNAAIKSLSARVGNSDLSFDGGFVNLLPYILFPNEKLEMIANLDAHQIHLEDFVGSNEIKNEYISESSEQLSLPSDINLNLKLDIDKFNYGEMHAEKIGGKLILIDQVLHAKDLTLKTAGGELKGRLRLDGSRLPYKITSKASISNMDVSDLFVQFEDFGQTTVLSDNISGTISADVDFDALLTPDMNINQNSIVALADINLKNGNLKNLGAMKEITDYMRDNRTANFLFKKHIDDIEKRLLDIKFSTLTNQISVKESVVNIPKMSINSSAMDLHLAGTHTFNNDIDYAIDFKFKDLKAQANESEFGTIIDDGTGLIIFMRMYGNVDDPQFEMDKASRKENRKEIIEEEKQEVKAVLQESLGLFKKDTTLARKPQEEQKMEFILYDGELEESSPEHSTKEEKTKRNKSNKNRAGKLFDKLLQDKKKDESEEDTDLQIEISE